MFLSHPFPFWHCKQTLNQRNNTERGNYIIKQIFWHHYLKGANRLNTERYCKYRKYWNILKNTEKYCSIQTVQEFIISNRLHMVFRSNQLYQDWGGHLHLWSLTLIFEGYWIRNLNSDIHESPCHNHFNILMFMMTILLLYTYMEIVKRSKRILLFNNKRLVRHPWGP